MSGVDLTELRRQKDPLLRDVTISASATKGRVVVAVRMKTGTFSASVTKHQARLLAQLLLDAAEE
jgi:hypothetical protein